ncbi:TonB-linked outer membrane protein, SusC/RagA family [Flavobacterium resistens]|uniref:SusC/RagA family TonB-linked outer membrane protein n=1 Tax=Flavobacterium resistens TaxID=443612 RepID=A0A521DF35_9FLAO|nr:TonB-dependent receptor [Flavobacterium resistens]MRX68665.1 SusC/RagA family TonB-linked outer membrane protein [Flavobacterium resistens]SMO70394.1 TonB-linked outer membrane protein, SusC/RagA family [Flavobacterium resistens]
MKINLKHFFWLLLVLSVQIAVAQGGAISGTVTDNKGVPIPGVNIVLKGTNVSTQTDFDGNFKIQAKTGDILVASYVSFATIEVKASNSMTIKMVETQNELEAVLVVGYGTQSKKNLTDNIARVTAKDIQQVPVANVQNALVGKLAGVQITQTNGKVEGGMNIRVRGAASISASTQPLYVLDGIPLITDDESSNGAPTNPLLTLSPNEIESIDVLKDASSAAIYGARGANGVVIITTKKGKEGKGNFSLNFSQGISEATHTKKFLNAKQYVELLQEAGRNVDDLESVEDELEYLSQGTDWRNGEIDTNWQDIALRTGYTTDADFSVSGGDDKTKYFFAGAYNNTTGIVDSNDLERITARSNVSHKITDHFTAGMNIGFSRSVINRVQDDNSFSTPMQSLAQAPISQARLEDGTPNPNTEYVNYLLAKDNTSWKTIMRRVTGKIFGELKLVKDLKFNSDFAYDLLTQTEDYWQGKNAPFMATDGAVFATSVNTESYIFSNYFTYDLTFAENHTINAVAGMEFNKYNRRYQDVNSIYFPNDSFHTVDGGAEVNEGHGSETDYAFVSQFGRFNYSFKNKYLFKASIRRDGSSRFGKNERFAVFPAFSAGWVMSQEEFLKDNTVLSYLKLKASWGKVGNAEVGNFASRQLYRPSSYNLKSGLTFSQAGNDNLTWEKSSQTDVGIEAGFLNKINLEVDYYDKRTDGLLFAKPLALSSGATSINTNIGEIKSSGFEFTLNTKNVETEKFKWTTSFNLTTNNSKVKSLPNNNTDVITSYNINRVGENISSFYLVEYAGVDPANGDALFVKNTVNADGSLDKSTTNDYSEAKRIVAGNPFPTLMSGLTNTINYKNFDFNFTFQGEWGASIYNSAGIYMSTAADYFDNQTADQLNRWQNPGDITNVPQARFGGSNGTQESTRYLDKADFIRLRNVTLGYSLPKETVQKAGMSNLRIYFTAVNLLTFTNYEGTDPEARRDDTGIGEDFYSAPPARTMAIGVNINF